MASFSASISASTDDGVSGTGSGYLTAGGTMVMGGYFGTANCWLRFPNVTIDQYANVSACTVSGNKQTSAGTADLRFYFVKEANPTYPTSSVDYDGRTLTTAYVDASYSGTGAWTSADLSVPLAEIFQQGGWANGNAIMLFIKDNNSNANHGGFENRIQIYAYDGGINIPSISVTWTAGASPTKPYYAIAQQ